MARNTDVTNGQTEQFLSENRAPGYPLVDDVFAKTGFFEGYSILDHSTVLGESINSATYTYFNEGL